MTKKPKPAKPNATQTTFFACDFGTSVPRIITVSSLFLQLRLRLLIILSLFSTLGRSGVSVFLQNLPNVGVGINVSWFVDGARCIQVQAWVKSGHWNVLR